eukprot:117929-Prymnesium_polylepis.2
MHIFRGCVRVGVWWVTVGAYVVIGHHGKPCHGFVNRRAAARAVFARRRHAAAHPPRHTAAQSR